MIIISDEYKLQQVDDIHLYRTNLEEIHNIIPMNLSTEINSTYQE